jgi:hypothetical protein
MEAIRMSAHHALLSAVVLIGAIGAAPATQPATQPARPRRAVPSADSLLPPTTKPTLSARPTTRPAVSADSLLNTTTRPAVTATPTTRPAVAVGPATRPAVAAGSPTTRQAKSLTADEMLSQLLKPTPGGPTTNPDEIVDNTPGGYVPDKSIPEGSYVHDVVGQIEFRGDPRRPEFAIEGRGPDAPAVVLMPNLMLMMMEDAVNATDRPIKFRLSGMVTEYNGKNYLLPEQVARGGRPLRGSLPPAGIDRKTGEGAAKPGAPALTTQREGTYIVDRLGRLTRAADGKSFEFSFDSDRAVLRDPPVIILPGNKLAAMENAVTGASRDSRFRITGTLTEYRGRNYIFLDKAVVVPEVSQQQL